MNQRADARVERPRDTKSLAYELSSLVSKEVVGPLDFSNGYFFARSIVSVHQRSFELQSA